MASRSLHVLDVYCIMGDGHFSVKDFVEHGDMLKCNTKHNTIPFGFGAISRSSASPRQVSLTISSCAQSHYISRLQSDTTWKKQQLIMLRTATGIDKGVVKSTKQTTGCDKARRGRRKTKVTLLQDGGDEAEWRLLWSTPIPLVVMADYASR